MFSLKTLSYPNNPSSFLHIYVNNGIALSHRLSNYGPCTNCCLLDIKNGALHPCDGNKVSLVIIYVISLFYAHSLHKILTSLPLDCFHLRN